MSACAWCERKALYHDYDENGDDIRACSEHRRNLMALRSVRASMIDQKNGQYDAILNARDVRAIVSRNMRQHRKWR